MDALKKDVINDCVKLSKETGIKDFEVLFKMVMKKRLSFYRAFEKNKAINIENIEKYLNSYGKMV